ncbi:MAG: hypothetical protein ACKPKO_62270 [Candidatus Fonsibacter sp.]
MINILVYIYMSEIVEFDFNGNAIACVVVDGNPLFKGRRCSDTAGLRGHQASNHKECE